MNDRKKNDLKYRQIGVDDVRSRTPLQDEMVVQTTAESIEIHWWRTLVPWGLPGIERLLHVVRSVAGDGVAVPVVEVEDAFPDAVGVHRAPVVALDIDEVIQSRRFDSYSNFQFFSKILSISFISVKSNIQ